jgi:hypothetical protein
MSTKARIVYFSILAAFTLITMLALLMGLWFYTIFGVVFGGLFAYTAPFVFGKKWDPPEPASPRRPVLRRKLR